jgi:hypothetical protein
MKKILLAAAACVLASGAAFAQPAPSSSRGPVVVVDRADVVAVRYDHRRHRRWVPAHWERGHRVPGHYVWR